MRIAIDYRVMSTEAADRGMGRYTQQQLEAVLELDRENEYVLACFPGCRDELIPPAIRRADNVSLTRLSLPTLANGIFGVADDQILRFSAELQEWLLRAEIDLYHAATPFIPPVADDLDVCPVVATLYDLIPLVYPGEYFPESDPNWRRNRAEYVRGLQLVRRASRVVAISDSARRDAAAYLGYPGDRSAVAYPVIDPLFRPLAPAETDAALAGLRRRSTLPEEFVLSVTGVHHSKNAGTLLDAHRRLFARTRVPLVVVLPTEAAARGFAALFAPQEGVTLLTAVSDAELCALFNAARLVVHPSRYEGFGYPVVEAMTCGTPVITTTSSSLPEVGGDAALLVDPDDAEGLAGAVAELWDSPRKREEMAARGLAHVRRFDRDQLARNASAAYAPAATAARSPDGRRRLAIWSSAPPLHCGVGDYNAELLEPLSEEAAVELFVGDDYLPSPRLTSRVTVHHFSAFERRAAQAPFDGIVYQMGGTFMQEFMYRAVRRWPGVVVLHDLLMGLGFFWIHRSRKTLAEFRRAIVAPEGDEVRAAYDRIMRAANGSDPSPQLQELFAAHYLLGWVVESSLAQIVHMDAAKAELEKRYPAARPQVVDMGVADPWRGSATGEDARIRWKHRLPSDAFVVGIFGTIIPIKRFDSCLEALAELRRRGVDWTLVVAGDAPLPDYMAHVQNRIEELDLVDAVRIFGHADRETFDELMLGVDAVLNLRYPSQKGMSAIVIRAMAAGKPTVVSDIPEWSHLPTEACWRVAPDEREPERIADRLELLATDVSARLHAAREARDFFERRGTLRHMAAQYLGVLDAVAVAPGVAAASGAR